MTSARSSSRSTASGDAFSERVDLLGVDPAVDRHDGEGAAVAVVASPGDESDAFEAVDDRGRRCRRDFEVSGLLPRGAGSVGVGALVHVHKCLPVGCGRPARGLPAAMQLRLR